MELALAISFQSSDQLRVLITDANDLTRWQVPDTIVPTTPSSADPDALRAYALNFTESPFTFTVTRTADSEVVFASSPSLVFKDQYLELSTGLDPEVSLFGVGEITRSTGLKMVPGTTTTLWARDMPAAAFDTNLYGSHPMYVALGSSGGAHGAFLRNSNGMDVVYSDAGDALTYKTIGGVLDLFIFTGPSPSEVAAQYTALVGRPAMMPYWSFGYHQCKYGYKTLGEVEAVWSNFSAAKIPLDTVWMDIDYMEAWKDWSYDPVNFPEAGVKSFVQTLHSGGQKFVVIVDPGILAVDPSWKLDYPAYSRGLEMDVFIRDGFTGSPYMSQVWPGPTYFPDWLHPNATDYWTGSVGDFWNLVPFDGLWTDMNEVSNFCNDGGQGQVCVNSNPSECPTGVLDTQTTCCLECSVEDASDPLDFPPFAIDNDNSRQALGHKTLPMSALHWSDANGPGGEDSQWGLKEYNVHNLFGYLESRLTADALTEVRGGNRPFVLSRSTFPGSGSHTAHWTGDNAATWDDLRASSVTVMNFALFGIPMVSFPRKIWTLGRGGGGVAVEEG